ncbi:MAG: DUF1861 family protein [Clostridia bacterium]|nr:DUF1861 family protein [Clostridia bacterium]
MANIQFHNSIHILESSKLTFHGVDGYDVYNCSIPFIYDGKIYMFGRVEKREEWAESFVFLFEKCGEDEYSLVEESHQYQLEDPYVTFIHGELILGGTHVTKIRGEIDSVYGYFYRGDDLMNMKYFTMGPRGMKDIRLVQLSNGRIGVFSRPKNKDISQTYGSESMIGFAVIDDINELCPEVIENAHYIHGIFENGQWGGCNQAYLLESGAIGVIGHLSERLTDTLGNEILSYKNISFIFHPDTFEVEDLRLIAERSSYPDGPAKLPNLVDCAFTSGIEMREDGNVNLYSGIGDCEEGRVVIPDPFPSPAR